MSKVIFLCIVIVMCTIMIFSDIGTNDATAISLKLIGLSILLILGVKTACTLYLRRRKNVNGKGN